MNQFLFDACPRGERLINIQIETTGYGDDGGNGSGDGWIPFSAWLGRRDVTLKVEETEYGSQGSGAGFSCYRQIFNPASGRGYGITMREDWLGT